MTPPVVRGQVDAAVGPLPEQANAAKIIRAVDRRGYGAPRGRLFRSMEVRPITHVLPAGVLVAAVARGIENFCPARLETRRLDFRDLARIDADLLAVNPPQRPASILESVEPDQRHLHEGGGPDGLDTLRLVLEHTAAATVRTTAADVLPVHTLPGRTRRRVLTATLPMHPAWHP